MKVLKFTLDQELPEFVYVEETLGLGDTTVGFSTEVNFVETLGLSDTFYSREDVAYVESLGLGDALSITVEEAIAEILGLGDSYYHPDFADLYESLGLGDAISESMDIYVEIDENIGFSDGGYGYLEIDFNLRWRTRTKKLNYGSGTAPYGDILSYGDGDVVDELKEFKVKVIRLSDDTLLRTATITITNKLFPDGSAQYGYTSAMNVTDNGYFEPNLRFEVFQVDVNDVWSPGKYLDITITGGGGDLI
jgi:hypothetical protein